MGTPEGRAKNETLMLVGVLTTSPGSGLPCDGCDQPIASGQVECRCADASGTPLRFHQWCYYARSTAKDPPRAPG